jgi:hypothetical protein
VNAYFNGEHKDFERVAIVDVDGRTVKSLRQALEQLCGLVKDIYKAQVNDVHLYNHDGTGAHLSLDYSLDPGDVYNQMESVSLAQTKSKGADDISLRIWQFNNVVSPAQATVALGMVIDAMKDFDDKYYLDMTSSCALLEESIFSLEVRLYISPNLKA